MDRETLIRTVVAGLLILAILWGIKYVEPYLPGSRPAPAPGPKAPAAPSTPGGAKTPAAPAAPGEAAPPAVAAPPLRAVGAEPADARPTVLGSSLPDGGFDLEVQVTPRGAAVERLALARRRYFKTVEDRHLPPQDRAAMDLMDPEGPFPAFAVPELRVYLKGAGPAAAVDLSQTAWKIDPAAAGPTGAAFTVDVVDEADQPLLRVRKTFALARTAPEGEAGARPYEVRMTLALEALDERVEKAVYVVAGPPTLVPEGAGGRSARGGLPTAVAGTWAQGRVQMGQVPAKDLKKGEALPEPPALGGKDVAWVGQSGKYFAVVLIPEPASPEGGFAAAAEVTWHRETHGEKDVAEPGVRLVSKEVALAPGRPVEHAFAVFAGPKESDLLETHYASLGLAQLVTWATPCCFVPLPGLEYISRGLVWLLGVFYALVHNYGVAIILLVIVLRVVLHPVQRWSTRSMLEMQKLAPKMQKIREEFAHDKERMQQELAKIGGLKQMGGCLPMFIQMPIWIALYGALGAAIGLRHAALLPASWLPEGSIFLQDLAAPDALVHWATPVHLPGHDVPLLGWIIGGIEGMMGGPLVSLNVLPLLDGLIMFLMQKATPTPPGGANPQADQQKKMMTFMTIFLALVLYSLPSGLCLYIFTTSLLGFFEQRYLKRHMEPRAGGTGGAAAKEAAAATQVSRVAGREKSFAERVEAYVKRRLAPTRDGEDGGKTRRRRKGR